jgi:ATP-dependent RNA helicase DeaD
MVSTIERATRQKIEPMKLPSTEVINDKRIMEFKQRITATITADNLDFYQRLIEEYLSEHDVPADLVAAALASLSQGDKPLLLKDLPAPTPERSVPYDRSSRSGGKFEKSAKPFSGYKKEEPREFREAREFKEYRDPKNFREQREAREPRPSSAPDQGMERFRIEVGLNQGVKPGNIVGAIANEADLSSKHIGRISIFDDHSTVDLPVGLEQETLALLQKVKVADKQLKIRRLDEGKTQSHTPPPQLVRKTEAKTERREEAMGRARRRGQMSPASVAARKKRVKE